MESRYPNLRSKVQQRLMISESESGWLTNSIIDDLYTACSFEYAINKDVNTQLTLSKKKIGSIEFSTFVNLEKTNNQNGFNNNLNLNLS